jgi:tRNA A-37 threonylcarbamoyl transferase component Bud32
MQPETTDNSELPSMDYGNRFMVNPTYRDLLIDNHLTTPDAFVSLEGAIVSGHPDRHVMRIEIGGVACYMKREHHVPIRDRVRNFVDGHGFVSVSAREAQTLSALSRHGIPAPEWIATGECSDGRAFLLVRDAGCKHDLRSSLRQLNQPVRRERYRIARHLGRQIAEIHNAGFSYPDLYAKHILVASNCEDFTFLDWQRARRHRRLSWHQRCRDLAGLNASLSDELADANIRLAFLVAYWRATPDRPITFEEARRRIETRAIRLLRRTSIREQRLRKLRESQPLFWLDGEALCITSTGRELLEANELARLAYPRRETVRNAASKLRISIGDNSVGHLTVRRSVRRVARATDWLRGRQSNAPECRTAAQLLREERLGQPSRLLAFGQRRVGWGVLDSFILTLADSATEGRPDDECRLAGLLAGDAKLASR